MRARALVYTRAIAVHTHAVAAVIAASYRPTGPTGPARASRKVGVQRRRLSARGAADVSPQLPIPPPPLPLPLSSLLPAPSPLHPSVVPGGGAASWTLHRNSDQGSLIAGPTVGQPPPLLEKAGAGGGAWRSDLDTKLRLSSNMGLGHLAGSDDLGDDLDDDRDFGSGDNDSHDVDDDDDVGAATVGRRSCG